MSEINPVSSYMSFIYDEILSAVQHIGIELQRKNLPKHLLKEQDINREKVAEQLFRRHLQTGGEVVIGFDRGDCNSFDEWLSKNKDLFINKAKRNQEIHLDPQSRAAFNALFMLYQANSHLVMLDKLLAEFQEFAAKHQLSTATQLSFLNKYSLMRLPEKETNPQIYDIFKNVVIGKQSDVAKEVTEAQVIEKLENLRKDIAEKCLVNLENALSLVIMPLGKNQENRLKATWESAVKLSQQDLSNINLRRTSVEPVNFAETRGLVDAVAFNNTEKLPTKKGITLKVVKEVEAVDESSIANNRISPGEGG